MGQLDDGSGTQSVWHRLTRRDGCHRAWLNCEMALGGQDWWEWHKPMDDPTSALSRRLIAVQEALRQELDRCPRAQFGVISLCAGQGRDLIEVLSEHPRQADVRARLVEIDPRNMAHSLALVPMPQA